MRESIGLTVQGIQQAVTHLSSDDLARFRKWFEAYDTEVWDRQFERDVRAGKLDQLADQALADFRAGRCREL